MVTELLDRSAPPPLPNTIRVRALLQRFYLYYIQKATISTIADPCAQDTSIHFSDLCSYHLIFCTFFPIVSGRTNKLCILKFEDFQDWMKFKGDDKISIIHPLQFYYLQVRMSQDILLGNPLLDENIGRCIIHGFIPFPDYWNIQLCESIQKYLKQNGRFIGDILQNMHILIASF